MVQTVAIDFDGVIHQYSKGWNDGTIYDYAVVGAFKSIEILQKTHAVAIFTTREVQSIIDWFRSYGYENCTTEWTPPFWNDQEKILVTNIKPAAQVYIDDRGIRFKDWDQTIDELRRLGII
jgi:hypothetical protein